MGMFVVSFVIAIISKVFHFIQNIICHVLDRSINTNNIKMKSVMNIIFYVIDSLINTYNNIEKQKFDISIYSNKVQTTSHFNISKIKSSRRRVAATYSADNENENLKEVMVRIELDTHADTIVAGANCCILEYTGRICDVSPYSDEYQPVQGVPIVKAATR